MNLLNLNWWQTILILISWYIVYEWGFSAGYEKFRKEQRLFDLKRLEEEESEAGSTYAHPDDHL